MNQDKDKKFDELLRRHVKEYRPEVSPSLWDRIEADLDRRESVKLHSSRKLPRITWAAAAVVLIMGAAFLFKMTSDRETLYLRGVPETGQVKDDTYMAGIPEVSSDPAQIRGEKKISDDIRTISRVLASTLERSGVGSRGDEGNAIDGLQENAVHGFTEEGPGINLEDLQIAKVEEPDLMLVHQPETHLLTTALFPEADSPLQQITSAAKEDEMTLTAGMDQEEYTAEPAGSQERNIFGVSRLLNLMVAQIDRRSEKFVSFSNDEEGSLKIDLNIAQNRK